MASSTATRRSISCCMTWPVPSRSSPEVSWRSAATELRALASVAPGRGPGPSSRELQLVRSERIERPAAIFDRATPALHRVLHPLQRNQRIDPAQCPQRDRRGLRLRRISFRPTEKVPPDARRAAPGVVASPVWVSPETRMERKVFPYG